MSDATTTPREPLDEPAITRVIFRRWRNGPGEVMAILLDVPENPGLVCCYQHTGQHSAGNYFSCMGQTRPATPEEYAPLKRELESIGYVLEIRKRRAIRGIGVWRRQTATKGDRKG